MSVGFGSTISTMSRIMWRGVRTLSVQFKYAETGCSSRTHFPRANKEG